MHVQGPCEAAICRRHRWGDTAQGNRSGRVAEFEVVGAAITQATRLVSPKQVVALQQERLQLVPAARTREAGGGEVRA